MRLAVDVVAVQEAPYYRRKTRLRSRMTGKQLKHSVFSGCRRFQPGTDSRLAIVKWMYTRDITCPLTLHVRARPSLAFKL